MNKANILLIEDEKNFAIVMRDYLRMNHYEVDLAEDGLKGLSLLDTRKYDLCITDIMMPLMDGFSLVSEIRKTNQELPILFLTARSMKEDMLKAFRTGADDYVVKPFDSEVLLAKIEAILKRTVASKAVFSEEYIFSDYQFHHSLRLLKHKDGSEFKLSPKESELLTQLLIRKNKVISKSKLLQVVWKSDNYFSGRSMDVYIVKLRKYLSLDKCVSIENIHGSGFRLCCTEKTRP